MLFIKKMKQLEIVVAKREKREADIVEDELENQHLKRERRLAADEAKKAAERAKYEE